jgi:pimeloyl-ACP methyl ester carboxylesterase
MRSTKVTITHRTAPVGPLACWIGRAAAAQAHELRTMVAIGVVGPVTRGARGSDLSADPPQPTTGHTTPTGRPVMLVHGWGGTPSGWSTLTSALRGRGVTVGTISYAPFGTSVEQLARRLARGVAGVLSETGADKVHLVGHSLGGIIVAQALADGLLEGQVDTVITIAAPFGGSPWANLLPVGSAVRSLRDGSKILRRIAVAPLPSGVRWVAFTASLDMIAPGRRSVPPHAEAQTIKVEGAGHVGLLTNPQVIDGIVAALPTREPLAA